MSLTMKVSDMVAATVFEDWPQEVVNKAKLLILDHVGCAIAGGAMPQSLMLSNYLAKNDAGGEAAVFGTANMFTAANAAHANGHAVSVLSLDDSFVRFGHPGASILPAALAVAEVEDCSGTDLLSAVITGYELSMRLGTALMATPEREAKVRGRATWQIYGSVTAAAKLHNFSAEQIAGAYGLTALHAPTPFLNKFHSRPMNWLKNNYGWACKAGVTSVELTIAGFHGNREILDGGTGFWIMAGSDRFRPSELTLPFADHSFVSEMGFKPYGVCRWIHTTVDCVRTLMQKQGLTLDNLVSLEIETVDEFIEEFSGDWPKSTLEGVFHIPYAVALELHDRSSALGLSEADLTDGLLQETAKLFKLSVLEGGNSMFYEKNLLPVRVKAILKNGTSIEAFAEYPKGHPKGPAFGRAEVVAKFLALTGPVIGEVAAHDLKDRILNIESASVRETIRPTTRDQLIAVRRT